MQPLRTQELQPNPRTTYTGNLTSSPVDVDDSDPGLAVGPQLEMVLQELPEQRPAVAIEANFQLGVGEPGCLCAVEEVHHRVEQRAAGIEPRAGHRTWAGPGVDHGFPLRAASRVISASRPASPSVSSFACAVR